MKVYLVGGAVRDSLLELPFNERDWVVVGATKEELIEKGYKQVGKEFPVFLHPETKEEYALARKERKTGAGHKAFSFEFDKNVSLEEDLKRRDITINAIAQDKEGNINDPYHGQQDIKDKKIRRVSDAFKEDPLRVLRVARFAAKLNRHGFSIDEDTMIEIQKIVSSGELTTLTKERLWMETQKALETDSPEVFFELIQECGALNQICPLADLDTASLSRASKEEKDISIRWASLTASNTSLEKINDSFNVPKECIVLAEGKKFRQQAFKFNNAFGLQFHPEVNLKLHLLWIYYTLMLNPHKLKDKGTQSIYKQLAKRIKHDYRIKNWLDDFLDNYLLNHEG